MKGCLKLATPGAVILLLSGCGSIISRTIPGQGHGNQYYPGVQWDVWDGPWRIAAIAGDGYATAAGRYARRPV